MAAQEKSLHASARAEAARAAWRAEAAALDPASVVFLDETSTHTALTRRRARAPRGQRAVGAAPRNRGPNVTLLAALTPTGLGPGVVFEGAADRRACEAFVEQFLVPSLRRGQVVVLDNLSAHKGERVRQLIAGKGCRLLFLPPYSPDFIPIELAVAKLKTRLRRVAARTFEALVAAIGDALDAITAADARGFFGHCGFPLPEAI